MRWWRSGTVTSALVLAALATASTAAQATPALSLSATVVYSDGSCGPVGLDAWVDAKIPKSTTSAQQTTLTRAYRPTAATLSVSGRVYKLAYDPSVASGDPARLIWGLRHIQVSRGVAKAVVGKSAVLHVATSAHGARDLHVRVLAGRCAHTQ
jgi:hypothetical protein